VGAQQTTRKAGRKKSGRSPEANEGNLDQAIELTETQVQTRVGDVRFLSEARAALSDIRKLYGLDAPKDADASEFRREALIAQ
jgi:hypothetical protein